MDFVIPLFDCVPCRYQLIDKLHANKYAFLTCSVIPSVFSGKKILLSLKKDKQSYFLLNICAVDEILQLFNINLSMQMSRRP